MCQSSHFTNNNNSIERQLYVQLANGQCAKKIAPTFNDRLVSRTVRLAKSCWLNEHIEQRINHCSDKRRKWIIFNWIISVSIISEYFQKNKFNKSNSTMPSAKLLSTVRFCNLNKINSSFGFYILIASFLLLLINTSTIDCLQQQDITYDSQPQEITTNHQSANFQTYQPNIYSSLIRRPTRSQYTSNYHHHQHQVIGAGSTERIEPVFDSSTARNVTTSSGRTVYLPCRVHNLAISTIEKCRSIKDHYRLDIINRFEQHEKDNLIITPIDPPEPIYTGIPIKLIKKRKLDLLDIETQQPNSVFKLPHDDIVKRAQTPLCKSMVQLHSRPINDDEIALFNLSVECDQFGPLNHLMISSDHPLQLIKNKQDLQKQRLLKDQSYSIRILMNQHDSNHRFESNHYCCTNISTGLSEMIDSTMNYTNTSSTPSQLAFTNSTMTVIKRCSSCSNSTLACTCSSCAEPIYMLPTTREQTEALSLEYPSNVVVINTDEVQFTRMSSFRKSLMHSDFCIKRKKVRNKESTKLKRRNTICESICHQRNCNLVHCSKRRCNSSVKPSDQKLSKLDRQSERRRSTGSINLIDSCCQTDLTINTDIQQEQSKSSNRLPVTDSTKRLINRKSSSNKLLVAAEVHSSTTCQMQQPMYEKINNKKSNETDERSSSGNWSATSSTKSPTQNDEDDLGRNDVKRTSYSVDSLAQQHRSTLSDLCKNNSEKNVINCNDSNGRPVELRSAIQQSDSAQKCRTKFANRDSESWLQFFESCNESTDTITNEMNSDQTESDKLTALKQPKSKFKHARPPKRSNGSELESISSNRRLEEHEDELLSIHSEDTDGYYTSMHTDSGLFRERAQQMPMNSTFVSNENDETIINKEQLSSSVGEQTKSYIDNIKKKQSKAPSPPVRSSSVMSDSSTLTNLQQLSSSLTATIQSSTNTDTFNKNDTEEELSVCSDATLSSHTNSSSQQLTNQSSTINNNMNSNTDSSKQHKTTEQIKGQQIILQSPQSITSPSPANTWSSSSMNSDIDLVKLRNKTTIDATSAYPSMVAYPENLSSLSSISSFGNLAFASSGNHRCTVISKNRSVSDNQQFMNANCGNQYVNTGSYVNSRKRDSTSSLDSKQSKRSLSTIGSYASLTKLKELLRPLRDTLMGQAKSSEKKSKDQRRSKKKQSKDDCLSDSNKKSDERKGFFTRFGSINRGKIVKSSHLEQLQSVKRTDETENEMIKLRNTINKWRIEPMSQENKVSNKISKEQSNKQFAEEDENEYYAKLSQQSNNILRNSVDYSLNNDLKRYSIASSHSFNSATLTTGSYLQKKQQQQQNNSNSVTSETTNCSNEFRSKRCNAVNSDPERRRTFDSASFTKFFPISRYTSKTRSDEEHQFLIPNTPIYHHNDNVTNARFSYASDAGSHSLGLSNNSALYATMPSRPKTLNLSASYNQPFINQNAIYGQTMLSNSYNCPFTYSSINSPFYAISGPNYQSLNSSTSSNSFYSSANNYPIIQSNRTIPVTSNKNVNFLNTAHALDSQALFHQHINRPYQNQFMNHQQISSSSSHQSASSYNYQLSSTASSLVNTPSSLSSNSPFHQSTVTSQQQSRMMSTAINTAIVSPFQPCKQVISGTDQRTENLKKSQEKLNSKNNIDKQSSVDDSLVGRNANAENQIIFRDSMRLTRLQREQMLTRIQQHRSSWTPSSSSPSESLGSSSNSSSAEQTPCNDINKLINELSNFDNQPSTEQFLDSSTGKKSNTSTQMNGDTQFNGRSDPIYGVNIARTRFSFPLVQSNESINSDMNALRQSNSTNINDFKRLLSSKAKEQLNGIVKQSASEQLKIARRRLNALKSEEINENTNEKMSVVCEPEQCRVPDTSGGYYEKETYDNVTDEESENQQIQLDRKASSAVSLMNQQQQLTNGFNNSLRTRIINGRVYKTPYRLEISYRRISADQ